MYRSEPYQSTLPRHATSWIRGFCAGVLFFPVLFSSSAGAEEEPLGAKRIADLDLEEITGSGHWHEVRLGDLNGDNRLDILLAAQPPGPMQNIGPLMAIDIEGNILWQEGEPNAESVDIHHDLPVQVHDLSGDGKLEVVYISGDEIHIRDGATGEFLRKGPLPSSDARDAIAFADFSGDGHAESILVKTRYTQVWALEPEEFDVRWTYEGNVGHFPWPHDLTGNGRDELVIGHALIAHDGEVLWELDLPGHADGVGIADVTNDGSLDIALATCGGATFHLIDVEGNVLWTQPTRHAQHVVTGNFRPETPELEVAGLDRGTDRSEQGQDRIIVYAHDGEELWREERTDEGPDRWVSIISRMGNWDRTDREYILAYRRGGDLVPELRDGYGEVVARFPFPVTTHNRAQHADILGDPRSEVLIWVDDRIAIYGNAEPYEGDYDEPDRSIPNPRLFNYTHYVGMP